MLRSLLQPATVRSVSVVNPAESKVSAIEVNANGEGEESSTNIDAPAVNFEYDIEYVDDLVITIVSTKDKKLPQKPVKLSILGCVRKASLYTKAVVEDSKTVMLRKYET